MNVFGREGDGCFGLIFVFREEGKDFGLITSIFEDFVIGLRSLCSLWSPFVEWNGQRADYERQEIASF